MGFQSDVLTLERDGHVATLWLDNPNARNAMGRPFWDDLPVAMAALDADPDVRAIVIAAKGKHFTSGLDLTMFGGELGDGSGVARRHDQFQMIKRLQAAITSVADCRKPVIAAVHGACIGGGIDLITACDIRLCAPGTTFSVRETRMAIVADVGTLQRLPKVIPSGHALELIYTGKDIDASRAREIGLVNDVVDDVVGAAQAMAAEIAANSPLAVQGSKAVLQRGEGMTIEQGLDFVALWNAAFIHSEDLGEAVRAFFEKRPPRFEGR